MTRRYVIRIIEQAMPGLPPDGSEGLYLQGMDFEAAGGRGTLIVTPLIEKALGFPSMDELVRYYETVPVCCPLRPDGKPNRPLTAYTVEIIGPT